MSLVAQTEVRGSPRKGEAAAEWPEQAPIHSAPPPRGAIHNACALRKSVNSYKDEKLARNARSPANAGLVSGMRPHQGEGAAAPFVRSARRFRVGQRGGLPPDNSCQPPGRTIIPKWLVS